VNAAFLLVTTAWLAGADAAPQAPAQQAPTQQAPTQQAPTQQGPVISSAPYSHGGGGGYGYNGGGYGYNGGSCGCSSCGCADTCCEEHESFLHRCFSRFHHTSDCCDTCNTCASSCDCGCEHESFLHRCFSRFHHTSDCCDTCDTCSSCGCANGSCGGGGMYGAPGVATPVTKPAGESIPAPKNGDMGKPMPSGDGAKKVGQAQPAPLAAPAIDLAPAAPKLADGEKSPY
jgi:hypothetical protein